MSESRAVEDAVRDRALELDLMADEVAVGGQPDGRGSRSPWFAAVAAAAVAVVVALAALERGGAPAPRDQGPEDVEPPVVRSREDVDALPVDVEAVITVDADPDTLAALSRLRRLRRVVLERQPLLRPVGDSILVSDLVSPVAALAGIASLREIEIADGHQIRPEALAALERLPVLERLELRPPAPFSSAVSGALVGALSELPLTELVLGPRVGIDDLSIRRLVEVGGLRRLVLPLSTINSMEAVLALRGLASLHALSLTVANVRMESDVARILDDRLVELVEALPELVELRVEAAQAVSEEAWLEIARLRAWRSFEVDNAPGIDARVLGGLPRHLQNLALGDAVADDALDAGLPGNGAALRSLHLRFRDELDARWVESIDEMPGLRELNLTCAARFGTEAIVALRSRVPGLRVLGLSMGPHLEAAAVREIASLEHLRELDVSGLAMTFTRLSAFGPLELVEERRVPGIDALARLKRLRVLRLDHCAAIPVAELRALADLPLRTLSLRRTPVVWDEETPDPEALRALWPEASIEL